MEFWYCIGLAVCNSDIPQSLFGSLAILLAFARGKATNLDFLP
jgi:hypothetical protein